MTMRHVVIAEPVPDEEIVARAVSRRYRESVEFLRTDSSTPDYLVDALERFKREKFRPEMINGHAL